MDMTKLVVTFLHIFGEKAPRKKATSRVIIGSKLPGFLSRRSGLDSRQVQVGLVVYTVEIWQDFLRVIRFCFPKSLSFHQCSILYKLILPLPTIYNPWKRQRRLIKHLSLTAQGRM